MLSAKKSKALSVLSLAAGATMSLGLGAGVSHAAVLTLYYNSGTGTTAATNTVDTIRVATNSTMTAGVTTDIILPGVANTVNVPVGDYISYGISAVVTNNTNTNPSTAAYGDGSTQAVNLGLSELGIKVTSSDATGSKLTPEQGSLRGTFGALLDYNTSVGIAGTGALGTGAGNKDHGDTQQQDGNIGDHFQIIPLALATTGADYVNAGTSSQEGFYAATAATPATAKVAFSGLAYQANVAGTVTLSPYADPTSTEYWKYNTGTITGTTNVYQANTFSNAGDVINPLPVLVVNITSAGPVTHPIISLTTSPAVPVLYGSSQGKLQLVGSNGSYAVAQITGLSTATGYVEANGFNPATDDEIYGVDVVGANAAQLTSLAAAINSGDSAVAKSLGVVASTSLAVDPFSANYNLFLTAAPGVGADDFLGIDLSSSNDSNLSGLTFSAVAVVPEPMSIGLLALGGLGLMSRRHRKS
jgi:hypothetical protein